MTVESSTTDEGSGRRRGHLHSNGEILFKALGGGLRMRYAEFGTFSDHTSCIIAQLIHKPRPFNVNAW